MKDEAGGEKAEIVIVRRRSGDDATGGKGGAWKIAYADFVTAMMAFFLVMWLINASNEETRAQVASYFNPIKLTDTSTGVRSLKDMKDARNAQQVQEGENREGNPPLKSDVRSEAELLANPPESLDRIAKSVSDSEFRNAGLDNAVEIAPAVKPDSSNPGVGDPFDPQAWEKVKDESTSPGKAVTEAAATEAKKTPLAEDAADTDGKDKDDGAQARDEAAEVARDIAARLGAGPDGLPASLDVKASGGGVLISLTEGESFEMFETGSAKPRPEALRLMTAIAEAVQNRDGYLVIRGHTDSRPYRNKYYDNWQLSTARAHFARYMLVRGGLKESRIRRVEGVADREPRNAADPTAPENRRIEIFLGKESMKKQLLAVILACAATFSCAASAEDGGKPDAGPRPSVLNDIDALFLLQDATARGHEDAAVLQKSLLVGIGESLMAVAGDDPRPLVAHVAAYVLSGGDPRTAEKLAAATELGPLQRQLLEGVARFMRGERDEATKRLSGIDPMALPARLAGRMALAQALLATEPSSRQHAYAVAMSAMPGTLIEESALRRSALAYAEQMQEQPLWKRLERYQRRFPRSLYTRSFWEDIMDSIVGWAGKGPHPSLARLDLILASIALPQRRSTYLHLARRSAAVSNELLVTYAAGRARRLAVEGSQEDQVAKLYLALYAIASERGAQALRDLRSTPAGVLDRREQALRDAALSMAEQIGEPLGETSQDLTESLEKGALQTRAESLLNEIDALLTERGS